MSAAHVNGPGRFITLEGGEGVGKSTQRTLLADALRGLGLTVIETREPGGSTGAEAIRALLIEAESDAWSPQAEALLFAAARSDHVSRVIRPAIERGDWVICDRFVDSSRAYQGADHAMADADLMTLHRIGSDGLLPDRTILLELRDEDAVDRRAKRQLAHADRFEDRAQSYHQSVVRAFAQLAETEPARIRRVDAGGAIGDVTQRMLEQLRDILP